MKLVTLFTAWSIICLRTTVGYRCNGNYDCLVGAQSSTSIYCCKSNMCYFTSTSCKSTTCSSDSACSYPGIKDSYCCKSGRCSYSSSDCSRCSADSDCRKPGSSTYCCRSGYCDYSGSSCAKSTCRTTSDCNYPGAPSTVCCDHGTCSYTKTNCEQPPGPPSCFFNKDCLLSDSTPVFCCISGNCNYNPSSCSVPPSCSADYNCYLPDYASYCCRAGNCYYNVASCMNSYCSNANDCYYPGISGAYCCNNGVCGYDPMACSSPFANIDIVDDTIMKTAKATLAVSVIFFAISTIMLIVLARKSCAILSSASQVHHEPNMYQSQPQYSQNINGMYQPQPIMGAPMTAPPMLLPVDPNMQLAPGQPMVYMGPVMAGQRMMYQAPVSGQFMYPPAPPPMQLMQPGQLFVQSPVTGQIMVSPAMQQQYQGQMMPPIAPVQMPAPPQNMAPPAQLSPYSGLPPPAAPAPAPAQAQAQAPFPAEERKEK